MGFDMGRYAAYVWPAYGAVAVVFLWMVIDSLARARRWKRKAKDK